MSLLAELLLNVVAGWCALYLIVKLISVRWPDFGAEKEGPGATFKPGYVRYYTHGLNSIFYYLGRAYKRFWSVWFGTGAVFGFIAMVFSVALLVANLFRTLAAPSAKNQILTPVIPGVNVPASQMWYFFFTLLIAGVLHEFGHALAAIAEGRQVRGFGMFVMLIYPGAMVHISDDLHILSPFKQLKIFCAGAWHNFVLAALAYLLVSSSSLAMAPLFKDSALAATIHPGDRIVRINEYETDNKAGWDAAFRDMYEKKFEARSLCAKREYFDSKQGENLGCCAEFYEGALQCWKAVESAAPNGRNKFCYAASKIVLNDVAYCNANADCGDGILCATPVVPQGNMILNIVKDDGANVLFSAHPISLYQTVKMTDFQNRWSWLPNSMLSLPFMYDKFWNYMISISAALAVLNLAPVYWLDGEYALKAYLHVFLSGWTETDREWLAQLIFRSSTALFIVNMVVSLGALYF